MDISVVIPTWKGRHLLEAYLPSVLEACNRCRKRTNNETEVIIVEDAGNDGTASWLRSNYPNCLRLVEHEANRGFSAACQTGFENDLYPLVLLLNNDVRLEPDCISPMIGHFHDPDIFAVTGKMFDQTGDKFCNGGKVGRFRRGMWSTYRNYDLSPGADPDFPLISFSAIGAFSAFDRARFLEIGGFDPLAAMVEDVEISYRAWKRGWRVKYEPRSVAYHDASQTMDRRYRRRALDKLSRRSRILMHWMLLHDRRMFGQHLASIMLRVLTSWLALDWRFYWAIGTGLANIPAIARKRQATRRTMARSDRELVQLLQDFYSRAPIAMQ
jgi:GT2 family glycosyltransferase